MLIKIFGGEGEGKTTLAHYLEGLLKEMGFEVENHDETQELSREEMERNLAQIKQAAAAGDPLKIELRTIPYGRETLPQYAKDFQLSKKENKKKS